MPRVTRLTEVAPGRVAVDLDGREWRVLPADVVVRAGLRSSTDLEREQLRTLARELRRHDALVRATRRLRRRDVSVSRLEGELARGGVAPAARAEALGTLGRAGLLDDERLAQARAVALAGRGLGDSAIRWDLERQGIATDLAASAVEALEPEPERAERIVRRRGAGPRTARFLAQKGFSQEVVEAAAGNVDC